MAYVNINQNESANDLIGGLLSGFVGTKGQVQQRSMMDEYRKAQTDMIKLEAKKAETALKMQEIQVPIYEAIAKAAAEQGPGGGGVLPGPQQVLPAQSPQSSGNAPSLPDILAQGQTAGLFSGMNPEVVQNFMAMQNEFGQPIKVTDGFRTNSQQADLYARKPNLAAPPGMSLHERGLALDIDPNQANQLAQFGLLDKYGFNRPMLGQGASGKNEPWHIEYAANTQTRPQLTQFQPQQQPMITGQKLLEGYLKKNFGVEPDEAKVTPYGDHKLVTDKKGMPLFIIAGQGKMEMVDVKMPDGSVVRKPTLVPPSPLPSGIPVYNLAGQPAGGMMGPGGLQTAPPEYNYQEVKTPTGATNKIAFPKAQPGFSFQAEPPGIKIGDVGKTQQIMNAADRLNEVNQMVFPNGKLDRSLLLTATAPGGGIGRGAQLQSKMYQVIDAALRLETGAQATPGEIEVKMKEFWPSVKDTDSVVKEKLKDLNEYVGRLKKLQDPTGEVGKMGDKGKLPATGPKYKYNPATGRLEALQ